MLLWGKRRTKRQDAEGDLLLNLDSNVRLVFHFIFCRKKTLRPAAHSWIISSTSVSLFSSVSYQYTRSCRKKTLRPAAHSWIISSTSVSLFSSVSYQYTRSCRYKSQSLLLCYFYMRHWVVNLFSSLWIIGFCLVKPTLAHYWFHDVEFSCCPCKKGLSFMFRNCYI